MTQLKANLVYGLGVAMAAFHLHAGYFGQPEAQTFRTTHVAFAMALAFLLFPTARRLAKTHPRLNDTIDLALFAVVIALHAYILYDTQGLWLRIGELNPADLVVATTYIIVLLEATRRAVGMAMLVVAGVFMLNAVYGNWAPGIFYGPPHSWTTVINTLFLGDDGIFGIPVAASAGYIVLFIIFGQLLQKSRALEFFMNLAFALTGRQVGGPAKAAVLASALQGTYTGSAVANVVGSGTFTIPLMKRLGYPAPVAGGVEAVASSGGQIMPPVMGVTAFVLAEVVGLPYWEVAMAAILPAILYFTSVFLMVHFKARRLGMQPIPAQDLPKLGRVLREGGHLLVPIGVVFYTLSQGYSVGMAATWGIAGVFALSFFSPRTRLRPRDVVDALEDSARAVTPIAIACAAAGIIIGAIFLSGVGHRFTEMVLEMAGGQLWLALILTMVASFILGMGLTTTADYIVLATFVLPALVRMGADLLGAHMFAFYFASISGITPPVALASFAAAAIARSGIWETSFSAVRIGVAAFVIPFLFIYSPELLLKGSAPEIVVATLRALCAIACLAAAVEGWLLARAHPVERLALLAASVLFVWPQPVADAISLGTLATIAVLHMLRRGRPAAEAPPRPAGTGGRVAGMAERWSVSRRLAGLAGEEVAQEAAARPVHARSGERIWGWPVVALLALAYGWLGHAHLHVLAFNMYLPAALLIAFAATFCFTRTGSPAAEGVTVRPEGSTSINR